MLWVFAGAFVAGVIFPPAAIPVGIVLALIWLVNKYGGRT